MKEKILLNIDNIIKELKKGNDVQLKAIKDDVKIQSIKVNKIGWFNRELVTVIGTIQHLIGEWIVFFVVNGSIQNGAYTVNYIELVDAKRIYNQTAPEVIKGNIRRYMTATKTKHDKVAELLDITGHTAYSYTNRSNKGKPDLYNLLILADYFNIDVKELLE